jgi:YggT family protein
LQLTQALIFLINTLFGLYIAVLMLRLLFQLVRADFYNPISQALVKLTSPLVNPLRRVLPAMGRVDTASLLLALLFQVLALVSVALLLGQGLDWLTLLIKSGLNLVHLLLGIYKVALFVIVILSWVAPYSHHPAAVLSNQLTAPLLRPFRQVIPAIGGLDLSVLVVFIFLQMLGILFPGPFYY